MNIDDEMMNSLQNLRDSLPKKRIMTTQEFINLHHETARDIMHSLRINPEPDALKRADILEVAMRHFFCCAVMNNEYTWEQLSSFIKSNR